MSHLQGLVVAFLLIFIFSLLIFDASWPTVRRWRERTKWKKRMVESIMQFQERESGKRSLESGVWKNWGRQPDFGASLIMADEGHCPTCSHSVEGKFWQQVVGFLERWEDYTKYKGDCLGRNSTRFAVGALLYHCGRCDVYFFCLVTRSDLGMIEDSFLQDHCLFVDFSTNRAFLKMLEERNENSTRSS